MQQKISLPEPYLLLYSDMSVFFFFGELVRYKNEPIGIYNSNEDEWQTAPTSSLSRLAEGFAKVTNGCKKALLQQFKAQQEAAQSNELFKPIPFKP